VGRKVVGLCFIFAGQAKEGNHQWQEGEKHKKVSSRFGHAAIDELNKENNASCIYTGIRCQRCA
ncbi:MAG: hypothetical protein ACXU97_05520, partial [Thermodesulfobacteriota bacterium]